MCAGYAQGFRVWLNILLQCTMAPRWPSAEALHVYVARALQIAGVGAPQEGPNRSCARLAAHLANAATWLDLATTCRSTAAPHTPHLARLRRCERVINLRYRFCTNYSHNASLDAGADEAVQAAPAQGGRLREDSRGSGRLGDARARRVDPGTARRGQSERMPRLKPMFGLADNVVHRVQ